MAKRKIVSESRGFKGVWIPSKYWLDENLSAMEMLMLVEIDSLDQEQGCFASNKHFAEFFGLTTQRCSQLIKSLKAKGYINVEYQKDGKQIKKRVIKVSNKFDDVPNKFTRGIKYSLEGYQENVKGSNTSSRVIQDSNTEEGSKAGQSPAAPSPVNEKIPYQEIIDYLNGKTGSHFKNVAGNQKLIRARWHEGYRLDDFKKVIDNKTDAWLGVVAKDGREMSQFLRPSTLFGNKFDQYLNEKHEQTEPENSLFANQWHPQNDDDLPF